MMGIVDLGLVYEVQIDGPKVKVVFTLTSMGCPVGPWIAEQVDLTAAASTVSGRRDQARLHAAVVAGPDVRRRQVRARLLAGLTDPRQRPAPRPQRSARSSSSTPTWPDTGSKRIVCAVRRLVQRLPQVLVRDRLLRGGLPAVALPALQPAMAEGPARGRRIGEAARPARPRAGAQAPMTPISSMRLWWCPARRRRARARARRGAGSRPTAGPGITRAGAVRPHRPRRPPPAPYARP